MITASDIAHFVGGTVHGNRRTLASHLADLTAASPGALCWSRTGVPVRWAGDVLICKTPSEPPHGALIAVDNPRLAFCMAYEQYFLHSQPGQVVCMSETHVQIGEGHGVEWDGHRWWKFPQIGGLFIGQDVVAGSNVIVMRGSLGNTVIGSGVQLGHNVQIGHNCHVGQFSLISAGALLCGSVTVGERCRIWSGAIVTEGVTIGDDAVVGAGAVVLEDVPAGETWAGNPARRVG